MILDGERIKRLLAQAKYEVIICAPFIKLVPFKIILSCISVGVRVKVFTRWKPVEVALGVSDLEIFDVINIRENSELRLVDELHAKLYVADEACLAGSANLTGAALGWSNQPNLELLLEADRSNQNIKSLIDRIQDSELATHQIRSMVEAEAEASNIKYPFLEEINSIDESKLMGAISLWLPQCAAPDKLYRIYKNANINTVTEGTLADAKSDLNALLPPRNLNEEDFVFYIALTLQKLPSFKLIFERIPERVNDTLGEQLVSKIKPEMIPSEHKKQWIIVRDWIYVFMSDHIEVAPENFVLRLKPNRRN